MYLLGNHCSLLNQPRFLLKGVTQSMIYCRQYPNKHTFLTAKADRLVV